MPFFIFGVLFGLGAIVWGVVALILWPSPIHLLPVGAGAYCLYSCSRALASRP